MDDLLEVAQPVQVITRAPSSSRPRCQAKKLVSLHPLVSHAVAAVRMASADEFFILLAHVRSNLRAFLVNSDLYTTHVDYVYTVEEDLCTATTYYELFKDFMDELLGGCARLQEMAVDEEQEKEVSACRAQFTAPMAAARQKLLDQQKAYTARRSSCWLLRPWLTFLMQKL